MNDVTPEIEQEEVVASSEETHDSDPNLDSEDAFNAAVSDIWNEDVDDSAKDDANEEVAKDADTPEVQELESDSGDPAVVTEVSDDWEWDGNYDSVPEHLRPMLPAFKRVRGDWEKGESKRLEQAAVARKEAEALVAENRALGAILRAKLAESNLPGQPKAQTGPPDLPTGDDVTQEQWLAALDKRQEWIAEQRFQKAKESGEIVTREEYQKVKATIDGDEQGRRIMTYPGYTQEIGMHMIELIKSDPAMNDLANTNDRALFELAKTQVELIEFKKSATATQTVAAEKAAENIRKKALAGQNSLSRPGSTPKIFTPSSNKENLTFEDVADEAEEIWK